MRRVLLLRWPSVQSVHASWRATVGATVVRAVEAPLRVTSAAEAGVARHQSSSSSRWYHASALVAAKPAKKGKAKGRAAASDDDNDDDNGGDGDDDGNDTSSGGGKGGKRKAGKADDAAPAAVKLPDMKVLEGQMDTKLQRMASEFAKLRTGQANTELFKTVTVEAHGARVSVADAGQISVKSSTKISIAVFDPALVANVANAIRDCGMSLNPTIEGNTVAVSVPKPSKETRDALVKTAGRIAEKVRRRNNSRRHVSSLTVCTMP